MEYNSRKIRIVTTVRKEGRNKNIGKVFLIFLFVMSIYDKYLIVSSMFLQQKLEMLV